MENWVVSMPNKARTNCRVVVGSAGRFWQRLGSGKEQRSAYLPPISKLYLFIMLCLIFDLLLKKYIIDVFLPRLSLRICYKWINFDRKKCFEKMFFWPFVGNGFFWCPSHKVNTLSQQSVSCIDYLELRHFKKMKT